MQKLSMPSSSPPSPPRLTYFVIFIVLLAAAKIIFLPASTEITVLDSQPPPYRVAVDPDELRWENIRQELAAQEAIKRANANERARTPTAPLTLPPPASDKIRIAAAQFYSAMGENENNFKRLSAYIERAAQLQAQIIVFPEAALTGYADLDNSIFWARDPATAEAQDEFATFNAVQTVAITLADAQIKKLAALATKHKLYIAVPFIERVDNAVSNLETAVKFYNTLILLAPSGEIILTYRKRRLLPVFDSFWANSGDDFYVEKTPEKLVADTPLGKIGLLIGWDFYGMLPQLAAQSAQIILHSTAFYGVNLERWLRGKYADLLQENHCAVGLANWGINYPPDWSGYGLSRIIAADGKLIAAVGATPEERLVIGDLPKPSSE